MDEPEITDDAALKHDWKRNEDGSIDDFALEFDYHNGPVCLRCGASFCEHCEPNCYDYICPEARDASAD